MIQASDYGYTNKSNHPGHNISFSRHMLNSAITDNSNGKRVPACIVTNLTRAAASLLVQQVALFHPVHLDGLVTRRSVPATIMFAFRCVEPAAGRGIVTWLALLKRSRTIGIPGIEVWSVCWDGDGFGDCGVITFWIWIGVGNCNGCGCEGSKQGKGKLHVGFLM